MRVRQGSGPANVARTVICPCPATAVADSADPGSGGRVVNRRNAGSGAVGVFPPHPITKARNSTTAKRMGFLCPNAALIDSVQILTQFYIDDTSLCSCLRASRRELSGNVAPRLLPHPAAVFMRRLLTRSRWISTDVELPRKHEQHEKENWLRPCLARDVPPDGRRLASQARRC